MVMRSRAPDGRTAPRCRGKIDNSDPRTPLRGRIASDRPQKGRPLPGSPEDRYHPPQVRGSSGESRLKRKLRRTCLASQHKVLHPSDIKSQLKRRLATMFPRVNRFRKRSVIFLSEVLILGNELMHRSELKTINSLPLFAPCGGGSYKVIANLTLQSANQTFPFLVNLIETTKNTSFAEPVSIKSFVDEQLTKNAAMELKLLFDKFGSDKAQQDYHYFYGSILNDRTQPLNMLEIGLGTNYTDVVSHMGRHGRPGASLRAFREFLPNANIYGADIDKRILFEEPRIKTFFVDQTKLASFDAISSALECQFDLIIDDGLHSPNANLASLIFACKNLKRGGWFVVEDISTSMLPIWWVVSELLPKTYSWQLIRGKLDLLFVMRKTGPE